MSNDVIDAELRTELQQRLDAQPFSFAQNPLAEVRQRAADRRRRRVLRRSIGAAVGVAAAVVAVTVYFGGWLDRDASITTPPATDAPASTTTTKSAAGDVQIKNVWSVRAGIEFARVLPNTGHFIVADEDRVFVASGLTDPGAIVALNARTGRSMWRQTTNGPGGAALQATDGQLLIANSYDRIFGFAADNGAQRWSVSLSDLGLSDYWPVRTTLSGDVAIVGLSSSGEGNVRPPILLALATSTGEPVWQTALRDGTDLMWAEPSIVGDILVVMSTLSHPDSAPGNVAHGVDVRDGTVRWQLDLGGGQAFGQSSPAIDATTAYLPGVRGAPEVRAVDLTTGEQRWSTPGGVGIRTDDGLWVLRLDFSLVLVDPSTGVPTGTATAALAPSDSLAIQLLAFESRHVGLVANTTLTVIGFDGEVIEQRRIISQIRAMDRAAQVGPLLYVANSDNTVAAYRVGR